MLGYPVGRMLAGDVAHGILGGDTDTVPLDPVRFLRSSFCQYSVGKATSDRSKGQFQGIILVGPFFGVSLSDT